MLNAFPACTTHFYYVKGNLKLREEKDKDLCVEVWGEKNYVIDADSVADTYRRLHNHHDR